MRRCGPVLSRPTAALSRGLSLSLGSLPCPRARQCHGQSMLPTFNVNGDVVLVTSTSWSAVTAGDVVVATSPRDPRSSVQDTHTRTRTL